MYDYAVPAAVRLSSVRGSADSATTHRPRDGRHGNADHHRGGRSSGGQRLEASDGPAPIALRRLAPTAFTGIGTRHGLAHRFTSPPAPMAGSKTTPISGPHDVGDERWSDVAVLRLIRFSDSGPGARTSFEGHPHLLNQRCTRRVARLSATTGFGSFRRVRTTAIKVGRIEPSKGQTRTKRRGRRRSGLG